MKKRWIIMLALALLLLAACGGKQEPAQTESPAKPKTVAPLAPDLSLEDLEDCTFAAAFEPSDVHVTDGDLVITLAPYYTPKYDGAVTTQEPGTETPTYLPSVAPSPTASVVPTEMPADSNAPLIARTSESTAGAGGNPGSCLHYTDAAAAA